jgi:hypothetical protein
MCNRLQHGFKIGGVGFSADSKKVLYASARIQNRRCKLQLGITKSVVGYSEDSKPPLLAIPGIALLFSLYFDKNIK